jgi:hypothetical protein
VVPTLAELGEKYGICPSICMQIVRPILHSSLLATALAAEEQERVANEEAEKRLKAALAAKRDPSIANSRIASPAVGDTNSSETPAPVEPKSGTQDAKPSEDVVMENGDGQASAVSPAPEVSACRVVSSYRVASLTRLVFQSPWVPEIRALFEDVKKIAPKAAYDIIGSVTRWSPKQRQPVAHVYLDQDSTSRSGNCRHTISLRPPLGMRRKELLCVHSAARKIPSTPWRIVLPTGRSVKERRLTVAGGIDTPSSRRRSRRNSRRRRLRGGSRSSGWRRRRHTGFRTAQRRRRWPLPSLSIVYSRAAYCRLWTRTTALKSSRRFTSWAPPDLAR